MDPRIKKMLSDCIGRGCVLVGVGNLTRGDDGFGPALIKRLHSNTSVPLINAGDVPENFLGPITKTEASVVIFADAVLLDAPEGSLHWVRVEELDAGGVSTHAGSLRLAAAFIKETTGAEVYVLGVVPKNLGFGDAISQAVCRAVDVAAAAVSELSPAKERLQGEEASRAAKSDA